ncbi:MAG: enoyl-CoA hydratase/isomerase family protein [Pseudoxanthomonas sp.]
MSLERVKYERRGAGAWIIYNDPDNMNAISLELIADIGEALTLAEDDPQVRAIVLTGSGKAFCAGANLRMANDLLAQSPEILARKFLMPLKQLLRRVRECPKPVIAAVNGVCMAGGMETILCCDMVVAVEGALMGDQHATFGLLPAVGGAQGLIRTVGMLRAKEMLFTGGRYSAEELHQWGLVNKVVPVAELDSTVSALVEHLAQRSPAGLARMKQMANDESDMSWDVATRYEQALVLGHLFGGDVAEGLNAFAEKRKPVFGAD